MVLLHRAVHEQEAYGRRQFRLRPSPGSGVRALVHGDCTRLLEIRLPFPGLHFTAYCIVLVQ
ncbi:hypothetical protein [Streptomyces sp. P17]|uniref:Uncharacterized protein n=1 Tax=Streptomyces zinciresistens K42 TaxID=700597 RepID=G2GDE8_9ACTN|nr:hypothetical protein [Streptomyces sp. P17]EGX58480.1 hypothetical protein SZN_17627 [Streptomyces zinciresistens K42]MDT9695822.1 hypothetical protein [Streptomyces sp. P17]